MLAACTAGLIAQPWFKELTNQDIRDTMYKDAIKQIENDLTPFGFYDDGRNSNEEYDLDLARS